MFCSLPYRPALLIASSYNKQFEIIYILYGRHIDIHILFYIVSFIVRPQKIEISFGMIEKQGTKKTMQ